MALTPQARAERKLVNQFLAGDGAQATGYLGTLNQDITQNKAARRAAQQGARGQQTLQRGLGKMRGLGGTPNMGLNAPQVPTLPGLAQPGQMALPAAPPRAPVVTPGAPARPMQTGPLGSGGTPFPGQGTLPPPKTLPPGGGPIPQGPVAGGGGGAVGSVARTAASEADEFSRIAGEAAMQGSDDAARAAASRAGAATKQAVAAGDAAATQSLGQRMGVNITRAGMMRGAGVAGAGFMASQFFDGMDLGGENSVMDRGGSGAILGGSLAGGAAVALGIPHVAAAAAGGAILLGGYKALFGDKETTPEKMQGTIDDTRETIANLGQMYGIEGEAMNDIMLQYEASTSMYLQQEDKDGLKAFMAGMGTQLPALMLQAREQQKGEQQEQERYQTMMAAQAQFAPIFERTLDRASQASQTAYQTANGAANYLDQRQPQLAALYRQTAAQSQSSAANLQAAYAKQMASAPVTTGTTDQLQRQLAQEELMAQQLQMAGQF